MSYGNSSYGSTSYGALSGGTSGPITGAVAETTTLSGTLESSFNGGVIISDDPTIDDTITDLLTKVGIIVSSITVSLQTILDDYARIFDVMTASDSISANATLNVYAIGSLTASDRIYIALPTTISEDIEIVHSEVITKEALLGILDGLSSSDILATSGLLHTSTVDDIEIASSFAQFFSMLINDAFETSSTLIIEMVGSVTAEETIEVAGTLLESISYFIESISGIEVDDSNGSSHSAVVDIEENITIGHLLNRPYDVKTFVMNPENYAVTTYSFGFTSSTLFDRDYLFADSTGLYRLEGDTDNGSAIVATIETAALDFETSSIKQIPAVLLGTNGTDLILKVTTDGSESALYKISGKPSRLGTKHIKLGKGLKGRYWQFTLITDSNSDLDLDSFEFYPITFKRKHNG